MNIYDRQGLKKAAAERIAGAAYNPRLLVLIHTGVSLGASLLVAVLLYLLQQKIDTTGGLSGIGLRSVLTTVQSVLQLVLLLVTVLWQVGIVYGVIQIARGRTARPEDLTAGFRRFGPVLRLKLLQVVFSVAIAMPVMYACMSLVSLTPLYGQLQEALLPIMEQAAQGQMVEPDAQTLAEISRITRPLVLLYLAVYIPVLVYLSYRVRLAQYLIMDEKGIRRPIAAMITSWRMTRRQASGLFYLDLSFWWFYGLRLLVLVLSYGDRILPLLGVNLPLPADGVYFLFFGLYLVAELVLYGLFGARVQTTYAMAYEALRKPDQDQSA